MARKCEYCDSEIQHHNANYCVHCGNELHDHSGFIKTNTPAIKLNKMSKEVLVSSVIKMLFYIFKIVMSIIGLVEIRGLANLIYDVRVTAGTGLFISSIVLACVCFMHTVIVLWYAIKAHKCKFPVKDNKVFTYYKKATPLAVLLAVFGFSFLAVCAPAEWMLNLASKSLTSFRPGVDGGEIARFIGDIVVDAAFIALSVLAYVHCRHISRCAYEHLERAVDEDDNITSMINSELVNGDDCEICNCDGSGDCNCDSASIACDTQEDNE